MNGDKVKLFLSHASEDKGAIAEPLYQALKKEFDVWYDQARITLGDSFYQKISEGIRECDFGVVIFSPHFFRKRWTQEEMDGLVALQRNQRKVILPIVHDMTYDDLVDELPMMAGKKAISTKEGIQAIVAAIRAAVGADQQNKDFDKDALKRAFGDFQSAKQLAKINENLSGVREGAVKVQDAAITLLGLIKARVDELAQGSTFLTASLNSLHGQQLRDRHLVALRAGEYQNIIEYINPTYNTTTDARLSIAFVHFEPFADQFTVLHEHALLPLFTLTQDVVWGFKDPKEGKSNEQVAEELIRKFIDFLNKQENEQR